MVNKMTKNLLREHKLYNSYNIAQRGGAKLFISYSPAETGRMSRYAEWRVVGMDFKTDPQSPWYDHGAKTFVVCGREEKQIKLTEAMQWCKDKYQVLEWEREPFGGYQIKGTIALAFNSKPK